MRRPQITDALSRTFFEEWARVGYGALSLDAVARRAGVGKAALYRRWRSKGDMAKDLILQVGRSLPAALDFGDRGSLEKDLYAVLLAGSRMMRDPLARRILPDLYACAPREPALMEAVRPANGAWHRKVAALLDRAVARGELRADLDRGLAADFMMGPLYWRLAVEGDRPSRAQLAAIARVTAAALAAI